MIKAIMDAVSIPVMAKVRIGHMVEAQILQHVGVDYIDVSSACRLSIADARSGRLTRCMRTGTENRNRRC